MAELLVHSPVQLCCTHIRAPQNYSPQNPYKSIIWEKRTPHIAPSETIVIFQMLLLSGTRSRTRTGTTIRSQDFKSCVSTIPPCGHMRREAAPRYRPKLRPITINNWQRCSFSCASGQPRALDQSISLGPSLEKAFSRQKACRSVMAAATAPSSGLRITTCAPTPA